MNISTGITVLTGDGILYGSHDLAMHEKTDIIAWLECFNTPLKDI